VSSLALKHLLLVLSMHIELPLCQLPVSVYHDAAMLSSALRKLP
jgi:hypothetical protein